MRGSGCVRGAGLQLRRIPPSAGQGGAGLRFGGEVVRACPEPRLIAWVRFCFSPIFDPLSSRSLRKRFPFSASPHSIAEPRCRNASIHTPMNAPRSRSPASLPTLSADPRPALGPCTRTGFLLRPGAAALFRWLRGGTGALGCVRFQNAAVCDPALVPLL